MYIRNRPSKGINYYSVVQGEREKGRVRQRQIQYLGRLDNLTPAKKRKVEEKIKRLGDDKIIDEFRKLIIQLGYDYRYILMEDIEILEALDYGSIIPQYKICEMLDIVKIIDEHTAKGGGTHNVGMLSMIMAINRNCKPCSREKIPCWYSETVLPLLIKIPVNEVYGRLLRRALEYFDDTNVPVIQKKIYQKVMDVFEITPETLFLDMTSVYFEGNTCVLGRFGHSKDGKPGKEQITVNFLVDQHGILITHEVFEGNTVDVTTLKRSVRRIRNEFKFRRSILVIDRGYVSDTNIKSMDRQKQAYIIALRLHNYPKDLINQAKDIGEWNHINQDLRTWNKITEENGRKKKYIVAHSTKLENDKRNRKEKKIKNMGMMLKKAMKNLTRHTSEKRTEIAEKKKCSFRCSKADKYFNIIWTDDNLFTFNRNWNYIKEISQYYGYFVLCTTEVNMEDVDVIESYRERDLIEKAIRTLKNELDIRPVFVYGENTVKGHIFICSLAYQIRSVMRYLIRKHKFEMSVDEALRILQKIKLVSISDKSNEIEIMRRVTTINGTQKEILEVLMVSDPFHMETL